MIYLFLVRVATMLKQNAIQIEKIYIEENGVDIFN